MRRTFQTVVLNSFSQYGIIVRRTFMFGESLIELLLIEDEDFDVRRIRDTIRPFSDRIHIRDAVPDGPSALELLRSDPKQYDVIIMDFQISGPLKGENLIRAIKQVDPSLQIIVVTKMTANFTDFDFASNLVKAGAFWYCTKYPGDIEGLIYQPTDFILSIFNASEKKRLEKDRERSTKRLQRNINRILAEKQLIGKSPAIRRVREGIEKCARTNVSVLISGPSGSGKELVAFNIHYTSPRRFENLVPVNCGTLPTELIESELFGYEKGAFTGATQRKLGLFEVANGGTLLMDEIGELPLSAQVKLLRVIEDGEIEKIGRTEKIRVDVRVIAATNENLQQQVKEKRFREDLFYRLNVVPIYVPPLRERPEDVFDLFDHFLETFSADMGKGKPKVDEEALVTLTRYSWPGNVRELKNVVQRLLLSEEEEINEWRIKDALGMKALMSFEGDGRILDFGRGDEIIPWRQMERLFREKYFVFVREHSGSDAEAAKKLGLAPPNYHHMCKEMGLK
jgi:two-component system response regulator AtoC